MFWVCLCHCFPSFIFCAVWNYPMAKLSHKNFQKLTQIHVAKLIKDWSQDSVRQSQSRTCCERILYILCLRWPKKESCFRSFTSDPCPVFALHQALYKVPRVQRWIWLILFLFFNPWSLSFSEIHECLSCFKRIKKTHTVKRMRIGVFFLSLPKFSS